jgi:hypothetical protein
MKLPPLRAVALPVCLAAVAIFFWWLWGFVLGPVWARNVFGIPFDGKDLSAYGQFGDLFGGVNALFAAMAAAFAFWAGWQQWKQTERQKEEIKEAQKAASQQTFEQTFFEQMRLFREVYLGISFHRLKGSKAMAKAAEICRQILDGDERIWGKSKYDILTARQISEAYDLNIYDPYEAEFGPYFRCLYHIFKTIHMNGPSDPNDPDRRIYYANFARAQLSSDAVIVLAINGIHDRGSEFKILIEEYGLLKHIPVDLQFTELSQLYDIRAFLSSDERSSVRSERQA